MNPKLYIVTNNFPYSSGENFLYSEVLLWAAQNKFDVTLLPAKVEGEMTWELPSNIEIDSYLGKAKKGITIGRIVKSVSVLFCRDFYVSLAKEKAFSVGMFLNTVGVVFRTQEYQAILARFIDENCADGKVVFYTYWNNEYFYALSELKSKYNFVLLSRMHRYDIYRSREKGFSMPLKHKYADAGGRFFVLSEEAKKYVGKEFGIPSKNVEVSRLGVPPQSIICEPGVDHELILLSCSNVVAVKQVYRIVDALNILASTPDLKFKWIHIGGGQEFPALSKYADEVLGNKLNVQYVFKGHLEQTDVYNYYQQNNIDVFVNVSSSEGQPVSIMEALSFGVPVIAPDVGGINEMIVDGRSGLLMKEKYSIDELVDALSKKNFFRQNSTRQDALKCFQDRFNADKNYTRFIDLVWDEYVHQ